MMPEGTREIATRAYLFAGGRLGVPPDGTTPAPSERGPTQKRDEFFTRKMEKEKFREINFRPLSVSIPIRWLICLRKSLQKSLHFVKIPLTKADICAKVSS